MQDPLQSGSPIQRAFRAARRFRIPWWPRSVGRPQCFFSLAHTKVPIQNVAPQRTTTMIPCRQAHDLAVAIPGFYRCLDAARRERQLPSRHAVPNRRTGTRIAIIHLHPVSSPESHRPEGYQAHQTQTTKMRLYLIVVAEKPRLPRSKLLLSPTDIGITKMNFSTLDASPLTVPSLELTAATITPLFQEENDKDGDEATSYPALCAKPISYPQPRRDRHKPAYHANCPGYLLFPRLPPIWAANGGCHITKLAYSDIDRLFGNLDEHLPSGMSMGEFQKMLG
jgi:hypothetical protein